MGLGFLGVGVDKPKWTLQ